MFVVDKQIMLLQMYIGDELVDQVILSYRAMQDDTLREAYVQGAINELLEQWDELIREKEVKPQFFIKNGLK